MKFTVEIKLQRSDEWVPTGRSMSREDTDEADVLYNASGDYNKGLVTVFPTLREATEWMRTSRSWHRAQDHTGIVDWRIVMLVECPLPKEMTT